MSETKNSLINTAKGGREKLSQNVRQIRLVCFTLDGQVYALYAADAVEILRIVAITSLPEAPHFIPGIIDLRGEIIPVVDLGIRFGFKHKIYNLNTPIIVAKAANRTVGLIVDQVTEVITVSSSEITGDRLMPNARYLKSVAKHEDELLLVVGLDDLFSSEEEMALQLALGGPDEFQQPELVTDADLVGLTKTG